MHVALVARFDATVDAVSNEVFSTLQLQAIALVHAQDLTKIIHAPPAAESDASSIYSQQWYMQMKL